MRNILIIASAHILIFLAVLAGPLMVHFSSAPTLYLTTEPVDPYSLTRGFYVRLAYDYSLASSQKYEDDTLQYFVFSTDNPARLLRVSDSVPSLASNEGCISGIAESRWEFNTSSYTRKFNSPQISQYFASRNMAKEIENIQRSTPLIAQIKTSSSCAAQVIGLEQKASLN